MLKPNQLGAVIAGIALSAGANVTSAAQSITQATPSNRIIVKYKDHATNASALTHQIKTKMASISKLPVSEVKPIASGAMVVKFNFDKQQSLALNRVSIQEILKKLRAQSDVEYAVIDKIGYFKPVPDPKIMNKAPLLSHATQWDEFLSPAGVFLESQPGARNGAWRVTEGESEPGQSVVVAVLDTGIENNPELRQNVLRKPISDVFFGWNFAGNNDDLHDETGGYHGTHVAGTIAATGPTVLGMGPKLKILPVKIPDASGMFYESTVINAIAWAVGEEVPGAPHNPYPAKVINMSFGIDEHPGKEVDDCDAAVQDVVNLAKQKGTVLAVAAGNNNQANDFGSPGGCKGVIRIASTGPTAVRAYYSNYGPGTTYAAPGGDKAFGNKGAILSTVKPGEGYRGSGFDFYQGTSMASPHVAGLAGLVFAAGADQPGFSGKDVEAIIYSTTHDFGQTDEPSESCRGEKTCGHGIIDANAAVLAAKAHYKHILNAPKAERLIDKSAKSCAASMAFFGKPELETAEGTWILEANTQSCVALADYQLPRLRIDAHSGDIVASYGKVQYRLLTHFNQCEVIGIDGVGCRA